MQQLTDTEDADFSDTSVEYQESLDGGLLLSFNDLVATSAVTCCIISSDLPLSTLLGSCTGLGSFGQLLVKLRLRDELRERAERGAGLLIGADDPFIDVCTLGWGVRARTLARSRRGVISRCGYCDEV